MALKHMLLLFVTVLLATTLMVSSENHPEEDLKARKPSKPTKAPSKPTKAPLKPKAPKPTKGKPSFKPPFQSPPSIDDPNYPPFDDFSPSGDDFTTPPLPTANKVLSHDDQKNWIKIIPKIFNSPWFYNLPDGGDSNN